MIWPNETHNVLSFSPLPEIRKFFFSLQILFWVEKAQKEKNIFKLRNAKNNFSFLIEIFCLVLCCQRKKIKISGKILKLWRFWSQWPSHLKRVPTCMGQLLVSSIRWNKGKMQRNFTHTVIRWLCSKNITLDKMIILQVEFIGIWTFDHHNGTEYERTRSTELGSSSSLNHLAALMK